mmetsp:Transcript_65745/g.137426  ORF Transcript_65745/g.137426 Transcript_65745/m.137426 type:complete len:105 (+) Transcript_65745:155-469(+)|eukprot:CAMPEP_0206480324 /NCGR_PEP_ID=MMETSP0324_2-20121206/37218_1 /ASSEMBLY_ACC=CAM_ASM_000836 /TAXON_ID=2866 /ORGANISM="Crypthecodinium cohnii, Strain Seligo" /LENGTH=104 /DNA_ID=CAMNT_0053957073 /DNA_START=153 /DNA_END=467 /DNA_ORIENTATION=-
MSITDQLNRGERKIADKGKRLMQTEKTKKMKCVPAQSPKPRLRVASSTQASTLVSAAGASGDRTLPGHKRKKTAGGCMGVAAVCRGQRRKVYEGQGWKGTGEGE